MCLLVFDKLLFVLLGQACEHQPKHGQVDHRLTTAGQVLIVLAHAPRAADPGQGAFYYPPAWQMTKALGPFKQAVIDLLAGKDPHATWAAGMADYLHLPAHVLFDPDAPGSRVAIVDPDLFHARKLAFDRLQEEWDTLSILKLGAMHHHFEQQSHGVYKQVPFASGELFPPIIAMQPASLRGFDRLTINNRCTGCRFAPCLHAQPLPQRRHDLFPDTSIAPLAKVIIHRRPGRIIMR